MNPANGGPSSTDRARQTAADIARKKVLASYANAAGAYKQMPVNTASVTSTDWQKYHSAWQNYYQKYYSEYYAKAARQYVETEKMRAERALADQQKRLAASSAPTTTASASAAPTAPAGPATISSSVTPTGQEIESNFRSRIRAKASDKAKASRFRRRLMPIIAGASVILVFLFLQYNRLIFAPIAAYISPGDAAATSITAIDPTITQAPSADPRLIIPKLNVDVPVHFGISNDEATVNNAMNNGVAQFAIPGADAMPGQVGNLVITGHSAGDIYSNNQYKFIFSGLERLEDGDLIYVNYQSVRYTYSVKKKEVIEPTDVAALVYPTDIPILTLITCTPLGTSRYRLLVIADQINPAPTAFTETPPTPNTPTDTTTEDLPANEPSFFERIWKFLTGQN